MNKTLPILLGAMMLVLLPNSAFAHSPVAYLLSFGSIVFLAAVLSLIAKLLLVPIFLRHKQSPRLRAYVGVSALELCIMWFSFVIAESVSPSQHSLVIPLIGYPLHLILAFFPNRYLLKTATFRSGKAFILDLIFPALVRIFFYFHVWWPLYLVFGG